MAGNIGDLQVNLSANTSQMERDVSAALKRLETKGFNFGAGINSKAFTQPLGRITGASNEFQKSLDASNARVIAFGASAGAIYTVQKAFTSLISSTIEVQKSLTDINVILGASQKTLGQFGDSLFEIAKNSGQAFSTVATAAGELARQGLTVEQTLKRTSDALILARLSGLDAASSVEALTASINSFNSSALDSTQIVNKLASVDAAFAVSSGDLAEALKRVGSSAQDVGVSFDELLAIVASVNQTTARGGAVIGNSLKTIFTRVQRTEVLDQLEALGVAVRDLNGNTAPAIQILTGLAGKFDQLGAAQKSQVAELVGGVFQINILKAALGDLSKEYSVFGNALNISRGATDEAIKRNEDLNKTLSALLNKTVANLTKVGSDIGGLSFAPAIEKVLGGINTALEAFDVKGDSVGSKIGKGIFEGIGSFVSGPGLALLIGVFIKIFGNLAKFTTDAVRTVLGLNKEAQAQAQIQERINSILSQNPQLIQNILNKQVSLLQVEKDILTVIQAQSQARQQSTAIATTLTRGLISKGVTSEKGVITAKTKSQGFIPNFNANKEMMGAISGGYMPGNIRSMNIPNYGRVTYNDAETVKEFSGLSQPGIMPPADSEAGKAYKQKFKDKYGINPYANQGFIPNFLSPSQIAARLNRGTMSQEDAAKLGYKSTKQKQAEKPTGYGIPIQSSSPLLALNSIGAKQGYTFKPKNGPPIDVKFPVVPFNQESTGFKLTDLRGNLDRVIDKSISDFATSIYKGRQLTPPIDLPSSIEQARKQAEGLSGSIEGTIGGIFESAFRAAFGRSVKATKSGANFDVAKIPKDLGIFFPGAITGVPGDFKSSDSDDNRRSMALKILKNQNPGIYQALSKTRSAFEGFIPNFSPLDKALKTENKMGGRGVLDFKPGLGLYVRDGKTQPNFAAVMRDHPEGIANATQNSKKMQGMMSGGFIPNFAGFDPMSLFFIMQSMGGSGGSQETESKLERSKLAVILRERRAAQQLLKVEEGKEIKDQTQINYLKNEQRQLLSQENTQRATMNNQMGVFARDRGGKISGGLGGALGRFGSRYGAGLALGAPLLADTASQFIGNENTAGGRATKAGISGLGTAASYAGLGFAVGGPMGAGIGAGIGGIMAAYDVFQKLNDIMPDVAKSIEMSTEKFNNISAATQSLSVSLETLNSIEGRSDLDAKTRLDLRNRSETDFAKSITQLNAALPGAGDEIVDLYRKIGDTAELRQKISEVQIRAQRESKGLSAGGALLQTSQKINELPGVGMGFIQKYIEGGIFGGRKSSEEARKINLQTASESEKMAYKQLTQSGGQQLSDLFENFSKTGQAVNSVDIGKIQTAYKSGGINGIKSLVDELTRTGEYSKLISEELQKVDQSGMIEEYIQAWKEHQEGVEKYRLALAAENAAFTQGSRSITDIQGLQRQFSLPGGISSAALGNIDYSKIESNLSVGKSQAFGEQVTNGYKELSQELGFGADRIKYLSQYTEEAASIQKDFNNGIITSSQAFERLKLSIDKIEFGKNSKNMFSDERASARQSLMERSLKQGDFKEGFDPLTSFFDKFGDNAATTADKINKSFANLATNLQTGFEDAFGAFIDGTKTADEAFKDMLLSISQQIIKEQFSIGMRSLIGGVTGGGGFGEGGGGGILGSILGLFGGGKAQGGIIRKYSSGGHVEGGSGVKDDVPAMLTDGEYVLRKSAVNKYGKGMLDMLNQGGMVRGYASGGSVTGLFNNSYDFFGSKGEKLTENYTPEAFKTTVNAPSELGNVPALTGKFNISDMLSSRALMDENNPMNSLRTQRFLGMQGYQEQVSNFKTSYNEQYSQVQEARREAQKAADEENARRKSAYNQARTNMLIGGLLNVGMSLAGPLLGGLGGGGGGGGLGGLFGGGGGGGGGGIFGGILSTGLGLFQDALGGKFSQFSSMPGGAMGKPLTDDQKKAMSDAIERGQLSGFKDPFAQQAQLFPQFGGQGGGYGGASYGQPTSTIGGFQFGVGLGAPAGFQTYTQNAKQDYLMNFASPVAPIAPGRGNMVYDFLNQNSNPFGYNRGYAKGGRVRGYADGGKVSKFAQTYYPYAVRAAQRLGTSPEAILAQLAFESNYGTSGLSQKSFNLGGIQAQKDYQGQIISMPANADERARGDFAPKSYRSYNNPEEFFNDYVGFLSKDRYSKTIGVTDPAQRAQLLYEAGYAGEYPGYSKQIASVAGKIKSFLPSNIAGTNTPAVMAGLGLPSKQSFPLTAFSASTNQIAKGIDTIGMQPNPFANQARNTNFATTSPIMYSMTPSANSSASTGRMKIPAIGGGAGGIGGALMASLGGMKNVAGNLYNKSIFNPNAGYQTKMSFPSSAMGDYLRGTKITPEALAEAATQQDFLGINQQSANQILPFFQNLAEIASGNKQSLYQSVGSLYDMKNKGDYGRLSSKFSSFYGNNSQNRYSSFGEKGFNNYLKYIGASPFLSMSSLNSFKFPMTPNTYSPFAFGSQNFGGFGGSGYQSGFSSTGNAFSNYFSTGSRLGITPSWASRAAGGMIYGGTSTKDDVPAMLMGGEYVIRKDVVDRMGQPFFNNLNRGQLQGFAEGGPVGTGLPSVGGGGANQQDNSKNQFAESIMKLVKSLEQLNKGIEEQNRETKSQSEGGATTSDSTGAAGVTNNISISVNVDQNGKTTDSTKGEDQTGNNQEETDQEKFKKSMERSRLLAELLRQQVLKVVVEEQRPGGVLYQGSKGRDLGR